MKASAATVRHELDAPTMWGEPRRFPYQDAAASPVTLMYRRWRDPDDRRGEPKRRRCYWEETA